MIFTLEALNAKHGDSLLLHFGSEDAPQLILIDGGPYGVFRRTLMPRLEQIKEVISGDEPLDIRLLIVSHIDDDHIRGILELSQMLVELQQENKPLPYDISTIWHNSFDDIIGNKSVELSSVLETSLTDVSTTRVVPSDLEISLDGSLMMASVNQGRNLRNNVKVLELNINRPPDHLIMASQSDKDVVPIDDDLTLQIIGPQKNRVVDLQKQWDKKLEKLRDKDDSIRRAMAAAFVDKSVYNLASIIVLAKCAGKQMLLTGDARGDDIISGLKSKGFLQDDRCHVDLFKLPHHGSDRNVSTDFFRKVTADHYLISADGKHRNPDLSTLKMISEARGQDEYTIHLTNKERRLEKFFHSEKSAGKKYEVRYRDSGQLSIQIDLAEKINF
jgi:hypothetical protein